LTTARSPWRRILFPLSVGPSLFQLWQSTTGTLAATLGRPIHLVAVEFSKEARNLVVFEAVRA